MELPRLVLFTEQAGFAGCAQTLPHATPIIGKIQTFRQIVAIFEPMQYALRWMESKNQR